ncbi:MAG: lipoyl protein ligase domain-containing protein [Ilumatobacteraceae bacterium]
MTGSWQVRTMRASAAVLHGTEPDDVTVRTATWCEVDHAAIVLGSTQREDAVDPAACARNRIDIARRRSGGGAVLVLPGEMLWLDVVIPRHDPRWDDDLGRSMWWLGSVWATALGQLGIESTRVHHGSVTRTRFSGAVCWEGIGSGEVLVGEQKAVGISQRRTRSWARFQSSVHLWWRPELLCDLLVGAEPTASDLAAPYVVEADANAVRAAVDDALVAF